MTHVLVRLHEVSRTQTKVVLRHDGWGRAGGEWNSAFVYFDRAWNKLSYKAEAPIQSGPIDWEHPPVAGE